MAELKGIDRNSLREIGFLISRSRAPVASGKKRLQIPCRFLSRASKNLCFVAKRVTCLYFGLRALWRSRRQRIGKMMLSCGTIRASRVARVNIERAGNPLFRRLNPSHAATKLPIPFYGLLININDARPARRRKKRTERKEKKRVAFPPARSVRKAILIPLLWPRETGNGASRQVLVPILLISM